jgi:tetratricopeptide (TPR) repeat protein
MRALTLQVAIPLALCASLGCGDRDLNASVEKMNDGISKFATGQYTSAEKDFEEATTLSKDNHMAWYNLGQTREQQKKWEPAAEAYSEAVKHNDKDAMYMYRLGKAELMIKNLSQAETHLEQSVELNDRLFKAHFFLGKVYDATDQPKKAAEAWTKSCTLNAYFGKPFNELGKLYIKWDKLAEAVSVLDQGRINVKDPIEASDIYYHLGLAYERQNNFDKAVEAYSSSMEKRKDNIDALRQRGFAYAAKGDKAKARQDLESFVKQGGGGDAFHIQAANERLMRLTGDL